MSFPNPIKEAESVQEKVVKGVRRRYYRVGRTSRWYGGIATADCCGCNLNCVFCWSHRPRENPEIGRFYRPEEIGRILIRKAKGKNYEQVRISGNEPTIGRDHLFKVIEMVDKSALRFILETNGTLIDRKFAEDLSYFENLHVRVSIKGTNQKQFGLLTESAKDGFFHQLDALNHLIKKGISCHPAVMVSFSSSSEIFDLKKKLTKIDPYLASGLEEEHLILYPHVKRRIKKKGLQLKTY